MTTESGSISEKRYSLPEDVHSILRIGIGDLSKLALPSTEQIIIDKFNIDELEFASAVVELDWKDRDLNIVLQDEQARHEDLIRLFNRKLDNKECVGQFGEYDLFAKYVLWTGRSSSFTKIGDGWQGGSRSTLIGTHWRIASRDRITRWWLGIISDDIRSNRGNLTIQEPNRGHFALKLKGCYDYYIIPSRKVLIIHGTGNDLDMEKLSYDLLALSFVLGQRINIEKLFGFDSSGVPSAQAMPFRYSAPTESGCRMQPIPTLESDGTYVLDNAAWEVPLFRLCSQAMQENRKIRLELALSSYLDSLTGDIIPSYLRLQVALEAYAYWILEALGKSKSSLVKSRSEWERWVTSVKDNIIQLAIDASTGQDLYKRIKSSYKHLSGNRVRDAFRYYKVELNPDILEEIDERDYIVHGMEISKNRDGIIDIDREVTRISQLQGLLIALIALSVGYRGKIRWWHTLFAKLISPQPGEPAGWPLDPAQEIEAKQRYLVLL